MRLAYLFFEVRKFEKGGSSCASARGVIGLSIGDSGFVIVIPQPLFQEQLS